MDAIEAIMGRRSIRRYRDREVPQDLLGKVLEAGRWAPSASNFQPWKFLVVKDPKLRDELARTATYGKFLSESPVVIAVVIDPWSSNHPVEDGAAATMNILLAAYALGLGSCWVGSYNSSYEAKARKILRIPDDRRLLSLIALGYAAENPETSRVEMARLVCYDRFS